MTGDEDEAFLRHTQDLAKGKSCCWRSKGTDGGAVESKFPKKVEKEGSGGPLNEWISKMAPNELGDGISALESGSRAHTCQRVKLSLREKINAW